MQKKALACRSFFEFSIVNLSQFLNENHKKIKSFKILNEAYEGTFEDLLQDVMKRADFLGKMIGYAFFEMTDKSDKYNKLLRAMGLFERNPRFG